MNTRRPLLLPGLCACLVIVSALSVAAADPQRVTVTADSTNVVLGGNVLGKVAAGETFVVLGEQSGFYQIEFETGGRKQKGWIRQADTKPVVKTPTSTATTTPTATTVDSPKWLRVKVDAALVKEGTKTVGTLARNRVVRIDSVNGKWKRVEHFEGGELTSGYVSESECEVLDATKVGPGLNGQIPWSLSAASVSIDWAKNKVTLTAALPLTDPEACRLVSAEGQPLPETEEGPKAQFAPKRSVVRLSGTDWVNVLSTGTRSAWVVEEFAGASRWHRIDFPVPQLGTGVTARRISGFNEGLLVSLPIFNLLPGYQVEHAWQEGTDGVTSRVQQLTQTAGTSPRVADLIERNESWPFAVRVVVPFAATPSETRTHLFVIRLPDGSQTRTIKVQQRGDTIVDLATEFAPDAPLPVDVTVAVPSVELLHADQAVAQVKAAGLQPLLVDQATFEPRQLDAIREAVVLRQGVEAGERALVGSPLLLGVRGDDGLTVIDTSSTGLEEPAGALADNSAPPPDVPGDADAPADTPQQPGADDVNVISGGGLQDDSGLLQNSTTVDTGDELQFVDVNQSGLLGGSGGLQDALDPLTMVDQGGLITDTDIDGLDLDGNVPGGNPPGGDVPDGNLPDGNPPDGNLPDGGPPGGLDGGNIPGTLIPINPDPGLLLDPNADPDTALLTGLLKIVIDAILKRPDPQNLPGPIGSAITEAIRQLEAALRGVANPGQGGNPGANPGGNAGANAAAELAAVEKVLEIVVQKLQLSLKASDRELALDDWKAQRQRSPGKSLDKNGNGAVADDVVLHFVVWLQRKGLYNPATNVVVTQDGLGNTIATLPNTPVSPDWLNKPIPIVKPGETQPSVKPPASGGGGTTKPPVVDPLASLPAGKRLITAGDGPDLVKVPEIEETLVSRAKSLLDNLGLRIGNLSDLFGTDKVLESTLTADEWVPAESVTKLQVLRRVPDVRKQALGTARGVLSQRKLKASTDGKTFNSDVVTAQDPDPGEYILPADPIKLKLGILAPPVVGLKLSEAKESLTNLDLGFTSETRSFLEDQVVAQVPAAGALVEHGDKLRLTLHLPMPNVVGLTLAKARDLATQWDVTIQVANRLARDEDIVRGQSPAARTFVKHESDLNVGPVVTDVPDLVGLTIAQAETKLKGADLQASRYGELLGTDDVTGQSPKAATEIERGELVTLDARVRLPNYAGFGLLSSRDAIRKLGGSLKVNVGGAVGQNDVVYSQDPEGNQYVFPRTNVSLVPGVNVPRLVGINPRAVNGLLQQAGLKGQITSSSTKETSREDLVGTTVIDGQNPQAGLYRRADVGVVQLSTSQYILLVRPVPNVVRDQIAAAAQKISAAGFQPVIEVDGKTYTAASWAAAISEKDSQKATNLARMTVATQNPTGGTRAKPGTRVTISAGVFK